MSLLLILSLALVLSSILFLWSIGTISDDAFETIAWIIVLALAILAIVRMLLPFMGIEIWYG